jgi:response regulator RpfG family c-di-GMP phosphodiesterase
MIVELKGTHFDPEVVDVFLALEDEFNRIRRDNQEDETELMQPLEKAISAS